MAYTQDQYNKLVNAIATGAMEVEYDGPAGKDRVKFRTQREMLSLKRQMEQELGIGSVRTRIRLEFASEEYES